MKIATISINWSEKAIGGLQTPAVHFAVWLRHIGHDVDILGFTKSGKEHHDWVTKKHPIEVQAYPVNRMAEIINDNYDWVYFVTPPLKADFNVWFPQMEKIRKNFIIGMHGEYDYGIYGREEVFKIGNLDKCKAFTVIGPGYWGAFPKPSIPIHGHEYPEISVKKDTIFKTMGRSGLLYANRVTSIKGVSILCALSKDSKFNNRFGPIDVYGVSNFWHYEKWLEEQHPAWNRHNEVFGPLYDYKQRQLKIEPYKYFWDVHGSNKTEVKMARLNLAGVEALNTGCIVITDYRVAPDWMRPIVILTDRCSPDVKDMIRQADAFDRDPHFMTKMRDVLAQSPYGYEQLCRKFKQIAVFVGRAI